MLKVLVTGSGSRYEALAGGALEGEDKFKEFLIALGTALAQRKHQIIILSDNDYHADPHVLSGYAQQSAKDGFKTPSVRISYGSVTDPENRSNGLKFAGFRKRYPSLGVEDFNADGEYPFNRVRIVRDLDVVIVIGGEKGAKEIAEIAIALRKSVIPISSFGGVAERIWELQRRDFERVLGEVEPLTEYFGRTSEDRMNKIVTICERMANAQMRSRIITPRALVYVEFVCLAIWFTVLFAVSNADVGIPVMILTMSTVGIVLRSLLKLMPARSSPLELETFTIEIGLGVGVAVIYYLLFLVGGSSISRDLQTALKDNHARVSVGVMVSLLSVAVSFLLEDSIEQVSKKLKATATITG